MSFLNNIYSRFEVKVEHFVSSSNWKYKAVAFACFIILLSFFNNFSPLSHFQNFYEQAIQQKGEYFIYQTIKDKASNISYDWTYPEFTGINNRTFRLTLPLFVKIFHIQHVSIVLYGLQLLLGLVFLYMLINFFERYWQSKTLTLYALVGFTTIYAGNAFFIDIASYGDFFGYFFLFSAIYFSNPILIFVFLSLAFWGDERAGVGSGLVFLWWWFVPQFQTNKPFKIEINKQMIGIILAWLAYGAIRKFYLVDMLGMHDTYKAGEFEEMLGGSWAVYGFKFFWAFEAWWLLILFAFICLYANKDWLRLLAIVGSLLAMLGLSLTTFDSTRSGSYGFIILFLSLIIAQKKLTEKELKIALFLIALINFLHPLATRTNGTGFFLM